MSGGSYDYLCHKDASDLFSSTTQLQAMADRLIGLGWADDAARDTLDLLAIISGQSARVDAALARLHDVFMAIEWWDSADWGEHQVRQALAEYRGEVQAP